MLRVRPWLGISMPSDGARQALGRLLVADSATVANYQPGNFTGTLNASAWANSIGAAPSLVQATGGNQPIILPFSGSKYAYLPAVAGNTLTSTNKTVTGNQSITFEVALNDYTPAADVTLFSKLSGNDGFAVYWLTTDKVRIAIGDGASVTNVDVVAASSFVDGSKHTVTIAWADGAGATFSYDGVVSGSQVAAAKTLTNAAVALTIGSTTSLGKFYRLQVGSVYDFNAADWPETSTNATTQVSSTTGDTWTLNNTGAKLAQIVASPQLLFDGVANVMATGAFTLDQPITHYIVFKQITWTSNDYILDGLNGASTGITQYISSPDINLYAGTATVCTNPDMTLDTFSIVTAVFNGASSSIRVNDGNATTGNPGSSNAGGITLAMSGVGEITNFANIQVKELITRNVADSAATQAQIQALLKEIHGTP